MPVYEYFCSSCKSKFELLRPVSFAEQGASCPKCHREAQRIFSPFVAFHRFAKAEEAQEPIAGTMGPCSSCTATSCDTCY